MVAYLLVDAVVVAAVEDTSTMARGIRGGPVKIGRIVGVKVTTLMRRPAATGIMVGGPRISKHHHQGGNPHRLAIRALALVRRRLRLPLVLTYREVPLTATVLDSNMVKDKDIASTGRRSIPLHLAAIRGSSSMARLRGRTAVMVMDPTPMAGAEEGTRTPGTTGSREDFIAFM
jgi:hypothetical protein